MKNLTISLNFTTNDNELDALRFCQLALDELDPQAQLRVLQYLESQAHQTIYEATITLGAQLAPGGSIVGAGDAISSDNSN